MGWFDDLTGWFGNNKGWLEPVANFGIGAINNSNRSGGRNDVSSLLRSQIDRDYEEGKKYYDAYNQWQAGQAAAASSRAAAAAANANARQAAQRRGNSIQQRELKKLSAFYQPQKDAFDRLFPAMTNTYTNASAGINSLLASLQSPEALARLNQSVSAHQTDVPLPSYLTKKKENS